MKRIATTGVLLAVLLAAQVWGEDVVALSGTVSTDLRLDLGEDFAADSVSYSRGELGLELGVSASPTDSLALYGELGLVAGGSVRDVAALDDLSSLSKLMPQSLELREAYADLYGIFGSTLDIRIGRQRIAWGVSEGVSVVDVVNPLDLSDPMSFGTRLASDAVRLRWSTSWLRLEAVALPWFVPALLPQDAASFSSVEAPALEAPLVLSGVTTAIELPVDPLDTLSAGGSATVSVIGWDIGLSYLWGHADLPEVESTTMVIGTPGATIPTSFDVVLAYPRRHVAALTATGELLGIGLWGEAALYWPRGTVTTDTTALQALGQAGTVAEVEREWFVKGTAGIDYTFPGGLYGILQYVHGMAYENAPDTLHDYFILALEWKLLRDQLTIGPVAVALEIADFADVASGWAVALMPEVSVAIMDNTAITLGMSWTGGEGQTMLGSLGSNAGVYLKGSFSF